MRMNIQTGTVCLVLLLAGLCLGGCECRAQRPPFANYYGMHPDGRPPWRKWWVCGPGMDETGVSYRADYEFNLLLLYIGKGGTVYL